MSKRIEFGDFQTPAELSKFVVNLVGEIFGTPNVVIEPTCGVGAFLAAAVQQWGSATKYLGYEINPVYVEQAKGLLDSNNVYIEQADFFVVDWNNILYKQQNEKVLILGNPPWVTNSKLGALEGSNLPEKTNFQRHRGFDAKTGKSNFDISEWMLIKLIENLPPTGALAMLCKTSTARKVLRQFWKNNRGFEKAYMFMIDAKTYFAASVDACLLYVSGHSLTARECLVYPDLSLAKQSIRFGYVNGDLVSDVDAFTRTRYLDQGTTNYVWRSGIKHDAAKIMELDVAPHGLVNGLGKPVHIEKTFVYPLLKSSDIGNGRTTPRKFVIVPQMSSGYDTSIIKSMAPLTWQYLMEHSEILDNRKSSIYKGRPRFSIFGIGDYSFAPWKIAISGLYKRIRFVLVGPFEGKPVLVDDTCYMVPCDSEEEGQLLLELLKSRDATIFFRSLVFEDAKRPITVDILKRFSFVAAARSIGLLSGLRGFVYEGASNKGSARQLTLLMERDETYQTMQ